MTYNNMLPQFPNFKNVYVFDRGLVEEHTKKFPPYSDYNFTSLWLWDVEHKRMISELNGNLVVKFTDYQTREPTFSLLGLNLIEESIKKIQEYAKEHGINPTLNYVTEETAKKVTSIEFDVEEDLNNFDYVFSTHKIADSLGNELKSKRRLSKKFKELYPNARFEISNLDDPLTQAKVKKLFDNWLSKKQEKSNDYETSQELEVVRRLFKLPRNNNFLFSFLYIDDELIGFAADEILANANAISHLAKADTSYRGVYEFLNEKTAQALLTRGILYWNWEQDLGVNSLHATKLSYHPVLTLKKYKIVPVSYVYMFVKKVFRFFSKDIWFFNKNLFITKN